MFVVTLLLAFIVGSANVGHNVHSKYDNYGFLHLFCCCR
jgi:hypothetical protein